MSTVLWANVLVDGAVHTDEQDRYALYRHADRLDTLARGLGLPSFDAACDTTDSRYGLDDDLALPEGMTSTTEVMAVAGAWLARDEATRLLDGLVVHIRAKDLRFGLLRNMQRDVLEELEGARAFLEAWPQAEKFNFAVVG